MNAVLQGLSPARGFGIYPSRIIAKGMDVGLFAYDEANCHRKGKPQRENGRLNLAFLKTMTLGPRWKPKTGYIILVLFFISGGFASVPEDQTRARQFTLPNGLRVVLYEKRDIPIVNISTAVDLGLKTSPTTPKASFIFSNIASFSGETETGRAGE